MQWIDHTRNNKHSLSYVVELVTTAPSFDLLVYRSARDSSPWRVTCNKVHIVGKSLAAEELEEAKLEALKVVSEAARDLSLELQEFSFELTTARGDTECSQSMY